MTDIDQEVWELVQSVVKEELEKDTHEDKIVKQVLKLTHGMIDYDGVVREISRQKRELLSDG